MLELGMDSQSQAIVWTLAGLLWSAVIVAVVRDLIAHARFHGAVLLGAVGAVVYLCYRVAPHAVPLVLLALPALWALGVGRRRVTEEILVAPDAGRVYRPVSRRAEKGISIVPGEEHEPTPRSVSPAEPE